MKRMPWPLGPEATPDPDALPRVERAGNRVRFIDKSGAAWTIWDTMFDGGRHVRVLHGTSSAQYRVFVDQDEMRRLYRFGRGELRELDVAHLERQLRAAEYLPATMPARQPADPR